MRLSAVATPAEGSAVELGELERETGDNDSAPCGVTSPIVTRYAGETVEGFVVCEEPELATTWPYGLRAHAVTSSAMQLSQEPLKESQPSMVWVPEHEKPFPQSRQVCSCEVFISAPVCEVPYLL